MLPRLCVVHLYVCHILVQSANAVGRNEMPFGRHTPVVPSNIALDKGLGAPTERGDFEVETPTYQNPQPVS